MRNVVGILVAAAVGIHCSAPTESPEDATAATEVVEAPAHAHRPAASSTDDTSGSNDQGSTKSPDPTAPHMVDFSTILGDSNAVITSTITDASGATYAAGTFVGVVNIGTKILSSHGNKDVFLLKVNPAGQFEWARGVGSAEDESGPRVTLDESANHVNVIGMTKGRLDCGAGPLSAWSSATFFLCIFGDGGEPVAGGVFPTGAP